jgi:para-aminobenzoate synthetase component 1
MPPASYAHGVRRFQVREAARCADAPPPLALLARLPRDARAVLLLDQVGGRSVLAWAPDLVHEGRLRPSSGVAAGASAAGPASRWPRADRDPAQELERVWSAEAWSDEGGGNDEGGGETGRGGGPGWFGWFAAACAHAVEPVPWTSPDPSGLPDWSFARYRRAVRWERDGAARLLVAGAEAAELAAWRAEFAQLCAPRAEDATAAAPPVRLAPERPREEFVAGVRRLRAWIGAGELFQANLSHALSGAFDGDPRAMFARLALRQPTRHGAYWEGGGDAGAAALLSHSPELFLRVDGASLATRPIKGTAPRGADADADARLAAALDADVKERAELAMIVDMARNDLGRVARIGSVRVVSAGTIERLPTLHHRTATVRAEWDPALGFARLWAAVFPPASVTGAPKVRALQAIAELEGEERGPYCGALGWWRPGAHPRGEFAVTIRTAVATGGRLRLRVGAGIVWDSDPQREWDETLLKSAYWSTLR